MTAIRAKRMGHWSAGLAVAAHLLTASAQDVAADLNPRLVSMWNGAKVTSIAVSRSVAYATALSNPFGSSSQFLTLDVSDPTNPSLLGSYSLPENWWGAVVLSGNLAYIVGSTQFWGSAPRLIILDVSDPSSPSWVADYDTTSLGDLLGDTDICLAGSYAYIAGGRGLEVVDIADPTNPTWVGSCEVSGRIVAVAVSGDYAYLADRYPAGYPQDSTSALRIIDIRNPADPKLVGNLFPGPGYAASIAAVNGVVFMDFRVIDVSNPTSPRLLTGAYGGGYQKIISGNRMVTGGLEVFDISNPTAPQALGRYAHDHVAAYPKSVAVADQLAYFATVDLQLLIIDLEPKANLRRIGNLNTDGSSIGIAVSGTLAAVANTDFARRKRVQFIDITDPANPTFIGEFSTRNVPRFVEMQGSRACVVENWGSDPYQTSLTVLDVSNPALPSRLGSFQTSGTVTDFAASGDYDYAFLGHYEEDPQGNKHWVDIVDLRDPTNPQWIGKYDDGSDLWRKFVVQGALMLLSRASRFDVIDVSNPTSPRLVGTAEVDPDFHVTGMALSGTLAYAVTADIDAPDAVPVQELIVFDLSDPTQPRRLGSTRQPGWWFTRGVVVSGSHVYVGGEEGIQVFDVSDPTQPRYAGGNSAVPNGGLAISGNQLFVARQGLQVFDLMPGNPGGAPTLRVVRSGGTLEIGWPATTPGAILESTSAPWANPGWSVEPATPAVVGDQNLVTLDIGSGAKFFRLKQP
ncbi:MAG: hypothetical protein KJ072_06370 [Verrucomicrobia bacterium]|nr:hypothetical protein [Verrucomicrobiota bacterium]